MIARLLVALSALGCLMAPWAAVFATEGNDEETHVTAEAGPTDYDVGITQNSEPSHQDGTSNDGTENVATTASQIPPTYEPVCHRGGSFEDPEGAFGCDGEQLTCGDDGLVFNVTHHPAPGVDDYIGADCIKQGEEPEATPAIDVPGEALKAFKAVTLPASVITVQPPGGETLVNLETILSTQAERFPREVTFDKPKITINLDIWPSSFVWKHGDDTSATTTWPGKPWTDGTDMGELITHVYTKKAKAVAVSVDTTWSARYRWGDKPWADVPGTVTIEGAPVSLTVLEAKPKLVR